MAVGRRGFDHQHAGRTRDRRVVGADAGGEFFLAHQFAFETRRLTAIQDTGQHAQRVRFPFSDIASTARGGMHRHMIAQQEVRHFRRNRDAYTPFTLLLGLHDFLCCLEGTRRNLSEIFLRLRDNLFRFYIADNHEYRVGWGIPASVPITQLLGRHGLQVGHPANHRVPVGMSLIGGGHEFFLNDRLGLVLGAPAALFHHHLDLLAKILIGQRQILQAVGFEFEGNRQARFFQLLEIGSVVVTGEGVLASAVFGDDARELIGSVLGRALEHHVLEHVRDAGDALGLVLAAHPVPDLRYHHRRAVILLDDEAQAVGQGGFLRLAAGREPQAQKQEPREFIIEHGVSVVMILYILLCHSLEHRRRKKFPRIILLKEIRHPQQTENTRPAGLFGRLREKLAATQRSFTRGLSDLLLGSRALDDSLFEELETLLLSADVGVETTQYLLKGITEQVSRQQLTDTRAVYHALRHSILSIVEPCSRKLSITPVKPFVIMVVGVNGVGKTTTIAKLANRLKNAGHAAMLAAAPHEVLLVLDAGTGQNALSQLTHFGAAVGVTGLALTKLDGTARGGILIAIARKTGLPIRYIGVGEGMDDLREFDAGEYVDALLPAP